MAGSDNYNHPSYLTRQAIGLSNTIAGASGTSAHRSFISNMRLRAWNSTIVTAGTIGTNVQSILQAVGTNILQITSTAVTTSTGTVNLGTAAFSTNGTGVGFSAILGDQNVILPAGTVVSVKNGADATAVTAVTLEMYLDPLATWTTGSGS